ncbi:MAG: hypothetical protein ACTSUK_04030, partial [Promethearchaeota archaeon]
IDEMSHLFTVMWDSEIILSSETKINYLEKAERILFEFMKSEKNKIPFEILMMFSKFVDKIKIIIQDEFLKTDKACFKSFENEEFNEYMRNHPNEWSKIYSTIFRYFRKTKDPLAKYLVWMFLSLSSREVYLQQIIKKGGFREIILASVDNIPYLALQINFRAASKPIFMTDAVKPPFNLEEIFHDLKNEENWILIDDPNNTCEKQKIIIYKEIDPFFKGFMNDKKIDEIIKFIEEIGVIDKSFQIYKSKEFHEKLFDKIEGDKKTWYRSQETIGVKSDLRKMIVFGCPQPPRHSYDYVAHVLKEQGIIKSDEPDEIVGRRLENHDARSAFFQAISRVKDPKGEEESIVYVYGISKAQVKRYLDLGVSVPEVITFQKYLNRKMENEKS